MKYGIQIFLFREYCADKEGVFETIRHIAGMGYDGIEMHGVASAPPAELKQAIADSGMDPLNVHIDFDVWRNEWEKGLDRAHDTGLQAATFGWIPPEQRTAEGYAWVRDRLPVFLQGCKERGLELYYHNHDFEFQKHEGGLVLDFLLESADGVRLQLDTFWAMYAGFDPLACMNKYRERLELLHVKDYVSLKPEMQCCPIGQGKTDNLPILRKAKEFGLEYVLSDLDNSTKDVFLTAEESLAYLREAEKRL